MPTDRIELSKIFAAGLLAIITIITFSMVFTRLFINLGEGFIFQDEVFYLLQGSVILVFSLGLLSSHNMLEVSGITNFKQRILLALKYFSYYLAVAGSIILLGGLIFAIITHVSPENPIIAIINSGNAKADYSGRDIFSSTTRSSLYFIAACFLIPVAEELFFRRLLYSSLRGKLAVFPSALISSALFAIGHFNSPVHAFIMGVYFAYIYEKHKDLFVNISLHSLVNVSFIITKASGL